MKFNNIKSIDIFCDIIDNYGDIGFVSRLANSIYEHQNSINVRVFLNDLISFSDICKGIRTKEKVQTYNNITYFDLQQLNKNDYLVLQTAETVIEAFGCEIPKNYFLNYKNNLKLCINIEYFTTEEWAKDIHLNSSFSHLPEVKKYFYMPGFDSWSGGVIISNNLNNNKSFILDSLLKTHVDKIFHLFNKNKLHNLKDIIIGTVFSYEYNFKNFLDTVGKVPSLKGKEVFILVFGDKSKKGFSEIVLSEYNQINDRKINIVFMNYLEQNIYDQLINISDFNLVRGEESFVRSALSGKPFLWHSYCQKEKAHYEKVGAFLKFLKKFFESKELFEIYSKIMYNYNSREENSYDLNEEKFELFFINLEQLNKSFSDMSQYIKENGDLVTKLLEFIDKTLD